MEVDAAASSAVSVEGRCVLLCLPSGRDADVASRLLQGAGISTLTVPALGLLADHINERTGAVLIASEAVGSELDFLRRALAEQPPWSDIPIVWLTRDRPRKTTHPLARPQPEALGNVLILDRPLGAASLLSAVQSALRARARQFVLRDRFSQVAVQTDALRNSQQALHVSEEKFRAITNSVDQMIWSTRADGYHDYYNDRWYEYTGMPHGSTDGDAWNGVFHPDDQARAWSIWRHSLSTGDVYRIEYRLRHHSGHYRWVLGRAQPMRQSDGEIVRWFGSCTDIDDIVKAREVLAASRAQLEQEVQLRTQERDRIWQASGDLFGVADLDAVWKSINPAWQRVLGWPPEAIIGRRTDWLTHPDDLPSTAQEIKRVASGISTTAFVNRLRRQDGSYCVLSWTAVPRDGRMYCVARDMTIEHERAEALKLAEEQLRQAQKMEAVGQLTGGIAHDFNNLLQGIIGSIDVIKRRLQRGNMSDLDRFIDSANRSARRAAQLTHRLLAFSRRQPLAPTRVDVNELIASTTDLLRNALGENVELALFLEPALEPAQCDVNQLESALLNMAINARDAMPGGGRLTITTARALGSDLTPTLNADARYVHIAVRDTGIGMSPEVLKRAFDPFFTTKPIGQGTGLGLSMIYGFAQQSGGQCTLQSSMGLGTLISLYLPVATANMAAVSAPGENIAQPSLERTAKVLVVEDEEVVRQLVVQTLTELGLQVIEAEDGLVGMRQLERHIPLDLLVTDVGLPGMDGRQLAEHAQRLQPGIKVLLITGYIHELDKLELEMSPGMAMLTKPFELSNLVRKTKQLIDPSAGA